MWVSLIHALSGNQPQGLKVRETAGVFFVLVGDAEDAQFKLVIVELLKSHCGRNGWKDRDVCLDKATRYNSRKDVFVNIHLNIIHSRSIFMS